MQFIQLIRHSSFVIMCGIFILACKQDKSTQPQSSRELTGSVEIYSDRIANLLDEDQKLEVLATGFDWTEGPVWVENHKMLLFSDIPVNSIYKWTPESGAVLYLENAGYTGEVERGGEMGSNGLALNRNGDLILCQHGDRAISVMAAPLDQPQAKYIHMIDTYAKMAFNSPNDLHMDKNDNIYFTDPPYGLENQMDDPLKELPFQGVYRLNRNGTLDLINGTITRPNGISLINHEDQLIVANSDPNDAKWYVFDKDQGGDFINKRVFHDATEALKSEQGLPDGLKWHPEGYLFATGPGGLWVFDGEGNLLAKIKTGRLTSNCAFDSNHQYLYMTADDVLLRLRLKRAAVG